MHTLSQDDLLNIRDLMSTYKSVPMDFADASIMLAAEQLGLRKLFTLDSDFHIYRLSDGSVLQVVP